MNGRPRLAAAVGRYGWRSRRSTGRLPGRSSGWCSRRCTPVRRRCAGRAQRPGAAGRIRRTGADAGRRRTRSSRRRGCRGLRLAVAAAARRCWRRSGQPTHPLRAGPPGRGSGRGHRAPRARRRGGTVVFAGPGRRAAASCPSSTTTACAPPTSRSCRGRPRGDVVARGHRARHARRRAPRLLPAACLHWGVRRERRELPRSAVLLLCRGACGCLAVAGPVRRARQTRAARRAGRAAARRAGRAAGTPATRSRRAAGRSRRACGSPGSRAARTVRSRSPSWATAAQSCRTVSCACTRGHRVGRRVGERFEHAPADLVQRRHAHDLAPGGSGPAPRSDGGSCISAAISRSVAARRSCRSSRS